MNRSAVLAVLAAWSGVVAAHARQEAPRDEPGDAPASAEAPGARAEPAPQPFDIDEGLVVRAELTSGTMRRPIPIAGLLPEGTYIAQRRGVLHRLHSGVPIFIFDPDADGAAPPPMPLIPSLALERMSRLAERGPAGLRFKVSGRVTVYQGRNYLLPTAGATLVERMTAVVQAPTGPEAGADPDETGDPSRVGDEVERLVAELEAQAQVQAMFVPLTRREDADESGDGADDAPTDIITDGEVMPLTSGRVHRNTAGAWVFTRDNDADAPRESGAPLILAPGQVLAQVERLAAEGRPRRFRIGGVELTHRGRAYLLPTIVIHDIDRTGNLTAAQ